MLSIAAGCGVDNTPVNTSKEVLANDGSCALDDGRYVVTYSALTGDCAAMPVQVFVVQDGRGFATGISGGSDCERTESCDQGSLTVHATCMDAEIEKREELSFDVAKGTGVFELRVLDPSGAASCDATYSVRVAMENGAAGAAGGNEGGAGGEGATAGGNEAGEGGTAGTNEGGASGAAGDEPPDPPECTSDEACAPGTCEDGSCVDPEPACGENAELSEGVCDCLPGFEWSSNDVDCIAVAPAIEEGCHIVAQDYEETYLGAVGDCDDPESICNAAGAYGAGGVNSIFNPDSNFGSPYGPYTAFGPYAYSPPQLVCDGEVQGCVTKNLSACDGEPIDPGSLCDCE